MKVFEYIVTSTGKEEILIRCKDCKWWNEGKQECMEWYDSPYAPADGYCFQAERKKNE